MNVFTTTLKTGARLRVYHNVTRQARLSTLLVRNVSLLANPRRQIGPYTSSATGIRSISLWPFSHNSTPQSIPSATEQLPSKPTPVEETASAIEPLSPSGDNFQTVTPDAISIPDVPIIPDSLPSLDTIQPLLDGNHVGDIYNAGLFSYWTFPSYIRIVLEQLHVNFGMPWWAAIVLLSITARLIAIPWMKSANINATGMARINPKMQHYMEKLKLAKREGDAAASAQANAAMQVLMKSEGVSPVKSISPVLKQGFIGISIWFAVLKMCNLPLESLTSGGMLSFTDLTVRDPTYALPIAAVAASFAATRFIDVATPQAGHGRNLAGGLTFLMLIVLPRMPAGVVLYVLTNSILRVFQGAAFRVPAVRERIGLAPLSPQLKNVSDPTWRESLAHAKEQFTEMWQNARREEEVFTKVNQEKKLASASLSSSATSGVSASIKRSRATVTDATRTTPSRTPSLKAPIRDKSGRLIPYKRPIKVYQDDIPRIQREEEAYNQAQQRAIAFESWEAEQARWSSNQNSEGGKAQKKKQKRTKL